MATNKTAIQAKITEKIVTGVLNPAADVRDVLKDSDDSLLEAIYSNPIGESSASPIKTTANSNFDYDVIFRKVGNTITLTGILEFVNSMSSGSVVLTINDTDLSCTGVRYYASAREVLGSDVIGVYIINNSLYIDNSGLANEVFQFTITYTALN